MIADQSIVAAWTMARVDHASSTRMSVDPTGVHGPCHAAADRAPWPVSVGDDEAWMVWRPPGTRADPSAPRKNRLRARSRRSDCAFSVEPVRTTCLRSHGTTARPTVAVAAEGSAPQLRIHPGAGAQRLIDRLPALALLPGQRQIAAALRGGKARARACGARRGTPDRARPRRWRRRPRSRARRGAGSRGTGTAASSATAAKVSSRPSPVSSRPNARMPGVSMTRPPPGSANSWRGGVAPAIVVIDRPDGLLVVAEQAIDERRLADA